MATCAACGEPRRDPTWPSCQTCGAHGSDLTGGPADDNSTPMTRTELAMLWDLLSRWVASHPGDRHFLDRQDFDRMRVTIDAELTERFGG